MRIAPFELERYFARYEFSVKYLLSCSDCEPFTLPELLTLADTDARSRWESLRLGYTESQGDPALREAIVGLHTAVSPEQVLVTAPEEGIFLAVNALVEAGDHVIAPAPGYQSLYEIARTIGCEITAWVPEESAGWRFDPDRLKAAVRPETKLIVLNFPHNPTGATMDRTTFADILRFAEARGIAVLSDEMYRHLEYDLADRLPSASDISETAVALSGLSKAFALAGLRIGWLTTRNAALMGRMRTLRDYTTICSSAPSEALALIALRAKERILDRNLGILRSNLRHLDAFFIRQAASVRWTRPRAGSIGLARLLRDEPVEAFCRRLVERDGVMLLPGTVYGSAENWFRIGFGRQNMPEVLGRLERFLAEEA